MTLMNTINAIVNLCRNLCLNNFSQFTTSTCSNYRHFVFRTVWH